MKEREDLKTQSELDNELVDQLRMRQYRAKAGNVLIDELQTNANNPHARPADLAIWFNPDGSADVIDRVHAGEYGANTCTFKLTPEQADALIALGSVLDEGQAKRLYEWKEERP